MSRWTYIRGSMELSCSPCEVKYKDNKPCKWTYPFPDKQFKLSAPELKPNYDKDFKIKDSRLSYRLRIYSLPRLESIMKEAIKFLPCGEHNHAEYSLCSQQYCDSSASYPEPHEKKYFIKKLEELYSNENDILSSWTYKELVKYNHVECDWVDYFSDNYLNIHTSLRWCSPFDVFKGFDKMMDYLTLEKRLFHISGYFFVTEGFGDYNYAINLNSDEIRYLVLNAKTNTILASKSVKYKYSWKSKIKPVPITKIVTESKRWKEFEDKIGYECEE